MRNDTPLWRNAPLDATSIPRYREGIEPMRAEDQVAVVHGVDPSSTWVGLASLEVAVGRKPTEPPALTLLQSYRPTKTWRGTVVNRILPTLQVGNQDPIAFEKPPPTAKKDANHGHQAPIGYAVGVHAALIAGALAATGWHGDEVHPMPGEWRPVMIRLSTAWGHPLMHAKDYLVERNRRAVEVTARAGHGRMDRVERRGDQIFTTFVGCDHTWRGPAKLQLLPQRCPDCAAPARGDRAALIRDAWKAIACSFVRHHWPVQFAGLLADAKGRARKLGPERPAHTYEGVADACEAVGIATVLL